MKNKQRAEQDPQSWENPNVESDRQNGVARFETEESLMGNRKNVLFAVIFLLCMTAVPALSQENELSRAASDGNLQRVSELVAGGTDVVGAHLKTYKSEQMPVWETETSSSPEAVLA